jgi:glycerol-3-phosphate acyltransferase PlsY
VISLFQSRPKIVLCRNYLLELMDTWIVVFKLAASFAIGAVPFAVIAMWGTGIDITKAGSGNPGFNNVLRVSSRWRAGIALVGDLSKGAVAIALLSTVNDPAWFRWCLGLSAVAGHCWTPFLRFNGGKGVATMAGALLYLEFVITAICLVLYPTGRLFGRRLGWTQEGAISSMTTMTVVAGTVFVFRGPEAGLFAIAALAIVVIRHIPNIRGVMDSVDRSRSKGQV